MKLQDKTYLLDMFESAKTALDYASGLDWETFIKDIRSQDAIVRRLEIIGEAANRISEATKDAIPDIPWRAVTGMRNLVIHEYDAIDLAIVWDTVQDDLPSLVQSLGRVLQSG